MQERLKSKEEKLVENTKKSQPQFLSVCGALWSVSVVYTGMPFARSQHYRWEGSGLQFLKKYIRRAVFHLSDFGTSKKLLRPITCRITLRLWCVDYMWSWSTAGSQCWLSTYDSEADKAVGSDHTSGCPWSMSCTIEHRLYSSVCWWCGHGVLFWDNATEGFYNVTGLWTH